MKKIKDYFSSSIFALSYSLRFTPYQTYLILLTNIVFGVVPYATAYVLGKLVNQIVFGAKTGVYNDIWYFLVLYSTSVAFPVILGNLQTYLTRQRMVKLQKGLELEILRKREQIDIAHYESPDFQNLLQRTFRNGPNPIYQLLGAQFDALRAITSLVVGTILAIQFDFFIYIVVITSAIPGFVADIKYAGASWSIWAKDSLAQRRFGDLRQHILSKPHLIEVKLFQMGNKLFTWMDEILSKFGTTQLRLERNRLWITSSADVLAFAGFTIGSILVVKKVISGQVEIGTLIYILGTLSNVRNSFAQFLQSISGQYENHLIVKDMISFMDTKPIIIESTSPKSLTLVTAPIIEFKNVSFRYNSFVPWSLRNINLTFSPGSVGLVGNNGAGKTTLVKLLCRVYEPTEGSILINGINLRDIKTSEWWSYLAVMFQDYANYDFLTKEAIAIGSPNEELDINRVTHAAHTSQSHTFIDSWENGYDQQLGVEFSGIELSKGQKQKLSIAKTLYRGGFIMILDEPTASVDAESEAKIFDSIENLPKDKMAILISHDFSTISECDKIFVLEEGILIEEGNHNELMEMKNIYFNLYNLQAERFKK